MESQNYNIRNKLRKVVEDHSQGFAIRTSALVYSEAVLEYLVYEVLDLARAAVDYSTPPSQTKKRITPRYLQLAIRGDEELNSLVKSAIAGGDNVLIQKISTLEI